MNNPIQWLEIATSDLERAKGFYSKVFKLEFQFIEMPDSKMFMFGSPDNIGSSGALVQSDDNMPNNNGTIIYFACKNIDEILGLVEESGGKVHIPKTNIGEFGYFAQFIDSEGNRIGVHSDV